MINKKLLTVLFCLSIVIVNCTKPADPEPDNNQNNTNNQPTVNHLCDGDKSATYWPLKLGNSWSTSSAMGSKVTGTITGTEVFEGKTYHVISHTSNTNSFKHYYRAESNGDIYRYVIYDNASEYTKDYMVVPGNPVVGTEWQFAPVFLFEDKLNTRKITSVNSTVKTGNCEYKDLIEVKEYNYDGELVNTLYFKKGLGLVREKSTWGNTDLTAVTLK